ncbi:MAG TPA: DNA-processing protein DprA [Roseimicrobium sp.]|nr:DNA-processing protein DprA [Roseimicrobium sp.]
MDTREALIALNLIEHVGPIRLRKLLEHFGDAPSILRAGKQALSQVNGIGEEVAESIAGWEKSADLSGELKRIRDYGCRVLIGSDDEYPASLREIYDPPIVLYIQGKLEEKDRHGIALVGTRMVSPYGQDVTRRLAMELAAAGVTVVSGGARGVDTTAHDGALSAKGRTIAVLGTGINQVFPSENAKLFGRIAENGAVLTQFPFNRPPDKQSFPIRNRIVAGMTLGTVVIEAQIGSGALITANMAADYGRQIFAVPGRVDSERSRGCHELIKKGAKLVESAKDILLEFEYLFAPARPLTNGISNEQPSLLMPALGDSEKRVFERLPGGEELSIDDLIALTGLPSATVSVALLQLEMKSLVKQLPGKLFSRRAG